VPYISVGQENSGSIDLYYEDHGSGRPVVLIHGWPLSSASWEKQVPALLVAGYRVISYDRRGFGNSSKPTSGYDYDTFAKDLQQIMTTLDLREVALVGHSMGGGEVARYIGTYGSDRVQKVAFIDAIPPFLLKTPDNPRGMDRSVFDGFIASIAQDRYTYLSWFLANFYNVDVLGGKLVSDDVVRASWNVGAASSAKGFGDCVPAWLTDFRPDLARITVPTLVVHGDADRILPINATGIPLHESIRGSRLAVIQGGPHGTIWTHAEKVNAELVNFLGLRTAVR
jgi:pimeloyl-ACP methyl ester carboxylesterase